MASKIEKLENNMAKLTVEVPAEDFQKAMKGAFKKNMKHFSIPGFRKGKAPMNLVMNYYGEGILYDDAFDLVADDAYKKALDEAEVEPFSSPSINITEIGSDKGVTFEAEFALKPEVKLGDYEGIEAFRPDIEVSDDEVDQRIEHERQKVSRMVPVEDRAVEDGDTVTIDYKGFKDGVAFEGGEGANYDLVIGSNTFIPGFEEQVKGHNAGEEFEINVTFPEEYHSEDLKGADAVFEVKIHEIKHRELPELDDEFVKDVSEECDTLEEYRAAIRKELEENAKNRADGVFMDNAVEVAVNNAEVDIPHVVIHDEINRMMDEQAQQMRYQGLDFDQYLGYLGMTRNVYASQLHEPAEQRVKSRLVLEAIADEQGFEITDEDYEKQFENMAKMYGSDVERIKKSFDNDEMREYLADDMKLGKASEFIKEHAKATDVDPKAVKEDEEKEEKEEEKAEEADSKEE